jgi:predicted phage terminase large subunit-like protein
LSLPEIAQIEREIGLRGSFADFVEMAWGQVEPGQPFVRTWHVDAIGEHLEAVSRGECQNLLVNIPPSMSKSTLVCVFYPVWHWIRDPGHGWITASFDIDLTMRDARKSLNLINSDWFRERWGDKVIVPERSAVGEYYTQARGLRYATSLPDGPVTGFHGDTHIVDDPCKPSNVTKLALQKAQEWFTGTLATRFKNLGKGRRIVVMQRLHADDLSQYCIDAGYTHLRLPMEYEAQHPCYTRWGGDPRTTEGELLCPERVDADALASLKKPLNMTAIQVAAQLQQRPVPAGGALYKAEWFKRWTILPKADQWCMSWDCAFKGAETSDYVVGQCWQRTGPDYYLVDQFREKVDFPGTLDAVRKMIKAHPRVTAKLIEEKANGAAVIATLEKDFSGFIPILPEGGKESRANASAPLHEAGNVYIPDDSIVTPIGGAGWVGEYLIEHLSFPLGKHDDQVDAQTQALTYLRSNATRLKEAMDKLRKSGMLG